jgi:hypothetical protein
MSGAAEAPIGVADREKFDAAAVKAEDGEPDDLKPPFDAMASGTDNQPLACVADRGRVASGSGAQRNSHPIVLDQP